MTTFTRPLLAASVLIGTVGLLAALGEEKLAERYRGAAGRIVGSALQDMEGWEKLTYLTTEIGPQSQRILGPRKSHRVGAYDDEGRRAREREAPAGQSSALGARQGVR